MAAEAETLLAGGGWLPDPLRTPGRQAAILTLVTADDPSDDGSVVVETEMPAEDEPVADGPHAIAAEQQHAPVNLGPSATTDGPIFFGGHDA